MENHYVRTVSSWDSGGGILLDIVELADGRVLGISEDSVVLYDSIEDLQQGSSSDNQTIFL